MTGESNDLALLKIGAHRFVVDIVFEAAHKILLHILPGKIPTMRDGRGFDHAQQIGKILPLPVVGRS